MASWDPWAPYTTRDSRPQRLSAANLFIILNLAGFLATGIATRGGSLPDAVAFLEFDAREAIGAFQVWQFVTYSFIQVIDFLFIFWFILAAYALYTLGNDLEAEIGTRKFLVYYFSFAAYGALAHSALQYTGPLTDGVRASTLFAPVAGISVAAALKDPSRPVLFFFVFPLRRIMAVMLAMMAGIGYAVLAFPEAAAPALGAGLAATFAVTMEPRIDGLLERRTLRRERDQFLQEIEIKKETEVILEKIAREGMDSLTRTELRILRGASALINREKRSRNE